MFDMDGWMGTKLMVAFFNFANATKKHCVHVCVCVCMYISGCV